MIEFFLNSQPYQLDRVHPNLTVLDWLRSHRRLTGTKEGCASGDCGACTVVLATVTPDGQWQHEAINSCISLVGSLHGKHLITVDALQQLPPHPVQTAMVAHHGSQCGFCTPGFIMSLFALHQQQGGQAATDENLKECLSGNLCRCTGYRPIMDAGRTAMVQTWVPEKAPGSGVAQPLQSVDMAAALGRINQRPGALEGPDGDWFQAPTSLDALRTLRAQWPEARLVAGSTDLALEITQQLHTLPQLISVQGVPELLALTVSPEAIEVGAAVPYETFRPALTAAWPAFEPMLARLGSRQIRFRGTLGGNIGNASPIADMPPPLIALGATLILDGPDGQRTLPLEDFFISYRTTDLRPGEFIRSVRLPLPQPDEHLFIHKISKRLDDDISAVLGAFWFRFDQGRVAECRLAWGGMAATPARARAAEAALTGQPWTAAAVAMAMAALASDFTPLSDVRASADYRLQVAGNLLQRTFLTTQDPAQALTVTDYA